MGKQQVCHHLMASSILITGCCQGMFTPRLITVVWMCEFSTIFLHLRELNGKHKWVGFWSNVT
jgi:hypothetical protein